MRTQKGFTLIELIIVIVILGILAAFAIPRFYDFGNKARLAAISSLVGSVNSALSIGHGAALANNQTGTAVVTITMDNTAVTFVNGYPDVTGIGNAVNSGSGFTFNAGTWTLQTGCTVTYTAAAAGGVPTVTSTTSGC